MSHAIAPIYRSKRPPIQIDTCEPQIAAMLDGKISLHALTKGHYPGIPIHSAVLPGIASIGFLDAPKAQDWGMRLHRNEGIEISFLETGAMTFTVESRNFELHSGHFTITRPWQLHKVGAPNIGPGRLHWIILDVGVRRPNQEWRWPRWLMLTDQDKSELTRCLRHNENPVWDSSLEIAAAFRGLGIEVQHWKRPHAESSVIMLLNRLLLGILSALTKQQKHHNPELTSRRRTVELFLRDLADNAASSALQWTLPKMAAHCGMGVTAFSNYCRELVNAGAVTYLNQCRLDRAARQIKTNPAKPVTDIAYDCGFNSSQYFATSFRRKFHLTPREYRG